MSERKQWRTVWQCECGASGTVEHAEDAGVYEVVERIRGAHEHWVETTRCQRGLSRVRIAKTGAVTQHSEQVHKGESANG